MNNLNNPGEIISGNDFIPSLMSFLEGDIVIADHSVILMFNSLEVPVENKIKYAELVLNRNLLRNIDSRNYLQSFINQNSFQIESQGILERFSDKIKRLLNLS